MLFVEAAAGSGPADAGPALQGHRGQQPPEKVCEEEISCSLVPSHPWQPARSKYFCPCFMKIGGKKF